MSLWYTRSNEKMEASNAEAAEETTWAEIDEEGRDEATEAHHAVRVRCDCHSPDRGGGVVNPNSPGVTDWKALVTLIEPVSFFPLRSSPIYPLVVLPIAQACWVYIPT